jgi:hypothetical protein
VRRGACGPLAKVPPKYPTGWEPGATSSDGTLTWFSMAELSESLNPWLY